MSCLFCDTPVLTNNGRFPRLRDIAQPSIDPRSKRLSEQVYRRPPTAHIILSTIDEQINLAAFDGGLVMKRLAGLMSLCLMAAAVAEDTRPVSVGPQTVETRIGRLDSTP